MNNIERITQYAKKLEIKLHHAPNVADRMFIIERCVGGDVLEIPLSKSEADFAAAQSHCYTLIIEVMVKRAPYSFERVWRWTPGEIDSGKVCFYHWDYDELLCKAADWLDEHYDVKTGEVRLSRCNTIKTKVRAIKCVPIGKLKHYTTVEEFKDE